MMRRKSTDALPIKRIQNENGNRQIKKRKHRRRREQEPSRARNELALGRSRETPFLFQPFRKEKQAHHDTSMHSEIAAPSGQL